MIKEVKLSGILMDNQEFIFKGKSMWLTKEEIEKYIEIVSEVKE